MQMVLNNLRCKQNKKDFMAKLFETKRLNAKTGAQLRPAGVVVNTIGDNYTTMATTTGKRPEWSQGI
jgi:hypothetical protein